MLCNVTVMGLDTRNTHAIETPLADRRDWRNLQLLLPYLWAYRWRVGLALTALLLAKIANVGIPLALGEIVDALDAAVEPALVLPLALLAGYGALRLASSLFNELRDAVFARVRYHAMRRIAVTVLSHLHTLALRFHLTRQTGAISRDLERGTQSVSTLLNYMVFQILPVGVEFTLVAMLFLGLYDPVFALVSFGAASVYVIFTVMMTNWRIHWRHEMNALDSAANSQALDSLINYETVKYFNHEAFEAERYDATLKRWEQAAVHAQVSLSALNFGQAAIIAAGVTAIMVLAADAVVAGTMSLGDLVMVNTLMLQLFIPLGFLGTVYRAIRYALADMDRLFRLLAQSPEIVDAPDAQPLRLSEPSIEFDDVRFAYHPDRPILHGLSFVVPAGAKVAVVGASGAGKSTLARLLYRLYDPQSGEVRLGGQPIHKTPQDQLRRAIGIVPQDTVLFNDTIAYNLQYANLAASREHIEAAAKLAHIHDFIVSLPKGYQTLVGERGLKLSGGEKQRIAIARALLKAPRILIFDEATASLDSQSEQMILRAMRDAAAHHTVLAIAHRLSTIVDADDILVMDAGQVVERGRHAELLALNGRYARMWALQQQDNTPQPPPSE